jgi:hypothetical protein
MNKKTLVFGASLKPSKYSNYVIKRLVNSGIEVVAFGLHKGEIEGVEISNELIKYTNIHTVSLYLNPQKQKAYYDYIVSLNPKRILFNPGTENPEFYAILKKNNINFEAACNLVLLSTNQY